MTDIHSLLKQAFAHADAGRLPDAAAALTQVLQLQPDHAEALHELGMLHFRAGRAPQAIELLTRSADASPENLRFRFNLALMLLRAGRAGEATPHFRRALELASAAHDPAMLDSIGSALMQGGDFSTACDAYRRSIDLRADVAAVHNRLGIALQEQGKLDEALSAIEQAIKIDPAFADAISNYLLTLNYHDRFTPEQVFAEHVRLARQLTSASPSPRPRRTPAADGRVRIAYLSPDFCQHSVAFFLWAILKHHDRSRFAVTCYADVAKPDKISAEFRKMTESWRPIAGQPNDRVAAQITADGIDILVDLTGHTRGNRMPLFARRVAPVQATYLGYPNTTGLAEMDYRITDAIADPVGQTESLHTERLIRLPDAFFCYLTPTGYPDVVPPPVARTGGITFAVMTNFAKVRPYMMELWAKIVDATPNSRLLIQAKALDDLQTHAATTQFFAERNLGPDRLQLRGWFDFPQFLKQLADVDIALDTAPFVGHTGSCNLLWMGVPVITLAGVAHRERMGASILTHLGLPELIANNAKDYIRIAVELAGDVAKLTELRAGMRQRMSSSPLMDGPRFVRHLEAAYDQMMRDLPASGW